MNIPRLFGVPRSGGTLIYNIVKSLYGPGLVTPQRHNYFKVNGETEKTIVVYRDFRDSIVSQWRVMAAGFDEEEDAVLMHPARVAQDCNGQLKVVADLDKFKEDTLRGRNILFLKYEDFFRSEISTVNFDFIFSELKDFLDINIDEERQSYIVETFSFKNQKKETKRYENFHSWDEETGVHGHHLYKGKEGTWRELVAPEHHFIFEKLLGNSLRRWGYV
jgi:hypothetical protein